MGYWALYFKAHYFFSYTIGYCEDNENSDEVGYVCFLCELMYKFVFQNLNCIYLQSIFSKLYLFTISNTLHFYSSEFF